LKAENNNIGLNSQDYLFLLNAHDDEDDDDDDDD